MGMERPNDKIQSSESVEQYFDNVCHKFESSMRYWGYCMPELLTSAITDQLSLSKDAKILDLGCGDGAVGEALKAKGFENLTGIDISKGMLDIAQDKGTYTSLKKGDLQQTLPFEDETFDCAVFRSINISKPHSLVKLDSSRQEGRLPLFGAQGIRVVQVDRQQDRLEKSGVWNKIWSSKPLPFLPSLEGSGTDKAKIFIYQKV